jgi:hypothetical protein
MRITQMELVNSASENTIKVISLIRKIYKHQLQLCLLAVQTVRQTSKEMYFSLRQSSGTPRLQNAKKSQHRLLKDQ